MTGEPSRHHRLFPGLGDIAYLDHAAVPPLPEPVQRAETDITRALDVIAAV